MSSDLAQVALASIVAAGATRAVFGGSDSGSDSDDTGTSENGAEEFTEDSEIQTMEEKQLERLIEMQEATKPGPEAIDAFAGETITLVDGATVTVEVSPRDGNNLRVEKLYFDRRTNHTYHHSVGGVRVSESHEALLSKPRLITHGGKTVSKATNNSGETTEFDFEMEGWAIPTDGVF